MRYRHFFVIKADHGRARRVNIEKGRTIRNRTELYGNLGEGDILLTKVNEEMTDNTNLSKVQVLASTRTFESYLRSGNYSLGMAAYAAFTAKQICKLTSLIFI